MTAVVVAILDRDEWGANTDVIVVVDPRRRSLVWVPRDLWSPLIGDRINRAFALGGNDLLMRCLTQLGFPCSGALTLRRSATEAALADAVVTVPVPHRLEFWYPAAPTLPIEEGRKAIAFVPPEETLRGERIHQWIGARSEIGRAGSDLHRCDRQQVFLRVLLADGFDFSAIVADRGRWRTGGIDPMPILAGVTAAWDMRTFRSVRDAMIDGKAVLLRMSRARWLLRRLAGTARGGRRRG